MEVKLITGFWHDCRPDAITYEAYSRHTGRRSRITAAALAEMLNHDSLTTSNAWGATELSSRAERADESASPSVDSSTRRYDGAKGT